jgi:hypothetical protein
MGLVYIYDGYGGDVYYLWNYLLFIMPVCGRESESVLI